MTAAVLTKHAQDLDADSLNFLGALCAAETGRDIQDALDFLDDFSVLDSWENYTILPCDEDYEPCD
jgi:hypothetical protein